MLLTIISTILGALTSLGPAIVQIFQKKIEYAQAIEMAKLDMQKMELANRLQIDLTNLQADIGEGKSLRDSDVGVDGGQFINTLRASVRPVLTYIFFLIFLLVKVSAIWVLVGAGLKFIDAMPIIWDENTIAIFGAIVGFWFGGRQLEKFGYAKSSITRK